MFSLPTTFQSQGTVPLTHLINVVQYLKSSANTAVTTSVQSLQRDLSPEHDPLLSEPKVSLKDLGLSELRFSHVHNVLERLLPSIDPEEKSISSAAQNSTAWRTSHISAPSFFQNKYVWVQNRGFKTMRSKTRHLPSDFEGPVDGENYTPAFMKSLLMKEKRDMGSLEQLLKQNNLPESQQDAFKTGFTEGFMKAQALTQRTQDSVKRTRLIIFVLLLVGSYGVFKSPLFSGKGSFSDTVRFRTTSGLDSAVDPVQMKNVTFEHVKGVEEAKNELQDVVDFLRNPQKFTVLGGKLPKGILLVGPPGTGKTLLARAVAGEADVPFYYASGSEFDEMFVGVGASRIRNLFKEAKASAPCVIFIDELDSVGGKRIESPMHPYSRQTINQLLAEMDGFKPNEGVIVIGATNFAEALDKGTVGFSGAELENLVNQAALKAAADGKDLVTMKELEFAKDKLLMGPERRSVEIDKRNKMITAYHESGHAIVAYYTKDAMPINKATIMPRGPSLGHVSLLPENDRWSETRAQLLAQMDVSMGGRVAEELVFGNDHITTGASSDFDGATKIAQMMVTRFGMSDKLGVMTYNDLTNYSPETQAAVEQEVRVLLQNSYERAKKLLKTYSKEHKLLADALLTYETLDAKEIKMILEGKSLDPR
ncbi:ATP-dependent zinc metalloprotease YME1L1 isoform X1 [Labeo rohita]|uniref:ATP-dependent zinc metalloprotease YME1L1 isoform X1 n=1 Tax=Labeo rohita TaxID=84645 RepID=A0A498NDN3_LABRO|nr:ATP-dependent zinc metalloprotease YME1L1 isoform X1 [Labeo rohita]